MLFDTPNGCKLHKHSGQNSKLLRQPHLTYNLVRGGSASLHFEILARFLLCNLYPFGVLQNPRIVPLCAEPASLPCAKNPRKSFFVLCPSGVYNRRCKPVGVTTAITCWIFHHFVFIHNSTLVVTTHAGVVAGAPRTCVLTCIKMYKLQGRDKIAPLRHRRLLTLCPCGIFERGLPPACAPS